jgi:translocation and assembly module TamA
MKTMMKRSLFLALTLLPTCLLAAGISYTVRFEGLNDAKALEAVKSISQLSSLKKKPVGSINALRFRAESDIPDLIQVLKAYGYYEANVKMRINETGEAVQAIVSIDPGPLYQIESYDIELFNEKPENVVTCSRVNLSSIGIKPGQSAIADQILRSEMKILQMLAECGYPLAAIQKREIVADGKSKGVRIALFVNTGAVAHFGKYSIEGQSAVKPAFFGKKILWKEEERYDSRLVEQTQKKLIDTGLFSSVLITHGEIENERGDVPMRIEVGETKYRSVNVGASYQTFYGPGLTFGWEHRNLSGMGRKLHLQGDVTKRSHTGVANYIIPDFFRPSQDFIWRAEAMHESITPYSQRSYNLQSRLERRWGNRILVSAGLEGERLYVTNSVKNGNFWLLEVPLYFRLSYANDLLNPTKGSTFEYKAIPSFNFESKTEFYYSNQATESFYIPVDEQAILVLAHKFTLGIIFSSTLNSVPVPKRLFGGSEDDLRGYRYLSVSPLRHHHKPKGGRSALFYTFEPRLRISKTIGLVPFFDLGHVVLNQFPTLHGKWFKSTGLGLRYFSFLGPLRLDLAFPLDRRKGIDPVYRTLVSIGQTF